MDPRLGEDCHEAASIPTAMAVPIIDERVGLCPTPPLPAAAAPAAASLWRTLSRRHLALLFAMYTSYATNIFAMDSIDVSLPAIVADSALDVSLTDVARTLAFGQVSRRARARARSLARRAVAIPRATPARPSDRLERAVSSLFRSAAVVWPKRDDRRRRRAEAIRTVAREEGLLSVESDDDTAWN
jgi:hypothetical protein